MELNSKKCKEMLISFLKYSLPCNNAIHVSGIPVESVSSFKLLGLMFSDDLFWNCHVDYVVRKANSRLYAIRQLKKAGLSQSDLVNIYCSFIRSRIEYASSAWSALSINLSDLIESIQKRALRIIYPYVSYEDVLDCTGLETLSSRGHNSCVKFISKLRSEEVLDYNPLAHIVTTQPQHFDHNYYLRTQPINKFITNTERFRNFVTAKYY